MDWNAHRYKALCDVIKVRDGDTIEVARTDGSVEAIRWPAHNAPELGTPYGEEAKARLAQLLAAARMRVLCVSFDEVTTLSGDRVRRHPLYEDPARPGVWINAAVVLAREGLTFAFPAKDQTGQNKAVNAACLDAMARGVGLWSRPDPGLQVRADYNPEGSDAGAETITVTNLGTTDRSIGRHSVRLSDAWGPQQRGFIFPDTAHLLPGETGRVEIRPGKHTHNVWRWDYGNGQLALPMNNPDPDTGNGDLVAFLDPTGHPLAWHAWLPT